MDKVIEIARFTYGVDAEILASLLRSEGIECHVKNGIISSMMFGNGETGGARVELLYKDAGRAIEIMQDHGYEIAPDILETVNTNEKTYSDYEQVQKSLARKMGFLLILLAAVLIALFILNKHYNG